MGIGTSIVLIAVGAILAFAVDLSSKIGSTTVHWDTVGWILMIVGALGLLLSAMWLSSARRRDSTVVERDRVVERDPYTT
jgi:hypothetical protein